MSEIHMETENVREAARRVDLLAGELYFIPGKLGNLANSLSSMWQGGQAGRYAARIRKLAELVHTETIRLQRLAIKGRQEVGEWEEADHLGQSAMLRASNMMPLAGMVGAAGLPLSAGGAMVAVSSATLATGSGAMTGGAGGGNLDFTWGLSVGEKGSENSKRTKDFLEAKVGVEGEILGGDERSDFKIGDSDIGGVKIDAKVGSYEGGLKASLDGKDAAIGAYGEFDAAEATGTAVLGGSMLGLTLSGTVSAGSADGFIGYKDGTAGASIGASAVSGEVALGANIAGVNVGVEAGAAAGVEFGFTLGKKTKVKFGPFRLGLSFGEALTDQ